MNAIIIIRLAFSMVPTPIVIAWDGTFSIPWNELAASALVLGSKLINRVLDFIDDPGSLKPI